MGGRITTPDGATVIWSVAEGARGRRWRWGRTERTGATTSVLLETTPSGRPTRLEVTSAAGLLTLHPEHDDREAHGNVVGPDGVRPLAFAWGPDHVFDVETLPWVMRACVAGTSAAASRPTLRVGPGLDVVPGRCAIAGSADELLAAGARWPLE